MGRWEIDTAASWWHCHYSPPPLEVLWEDGARHPEHRHRRTNASNISQDHNLEEGCEEEDYNGDAHYYESDHHRASFILKCVHPSRGGGYCEHWGVVDAVDLLLRVVLGAPHHPLERRHHPSPHQPRGHPRYHSSNDRHYHSCGDGWLKDGKNRLRSLEMNDNTNLDRCRHGVLIAPKYATTHSVMMLLFVGHEGDARGVDGASDEGVGGEPDCVDYLG